MHKGSTLVSVDNLRKHFFRTKGFMKKVVGIVKAVDGVNFSIIRGETLALVGESGCGKTTTGRCLLRAFDLTSGQVEYYLNSDDMPINIVDLNKSELKEMRKYTGMIFQDPFGSLNPRMNVLEIIGEPIKNYKIVTQKNELEEKVSTLLKMVGLDPVYMRRYPHAFSGGQRQRIAIARALALQPKFIIADEPVSALDVSVQAQILNLLKKLQDEFNLTYLFVAHNLAVVEYISDRIAVMHVGKIVELADTDELLASPKHPYTEALLSSIPKADPEHVKAFEIIMEGDIPDPADPPPGCYFHPRCTYVRDICKCEEPPMVDISSNGDRPHHVACHFADKLKLRGIKD